MYNTSRWNKEIVDQTGARYISPCCDEGGWTRVGGCRKDKEVGRRLGFIYQRVSIEPALAEIHHPISKKIEEETTLIAG